MDYLRKKNLIEQLQNEIVPDKNTEENSRVEFLSSSVTLKINKELVLKEEPEGLSEEDEQKQLEQKFAEVRESRRKNR